MSTRIIKVNRGDSFEFTIVIPCRDNSDKNYILTAKDALYFALLCPHQRFEDAIFIKGYSLADQNVETGEILIKIKPSDTRYLEPGIYYYTAKLQCGGTLETIDDFDDTTEVRTIIERTKFIINE